MPCGKCCGQSANRASACAWEGTGEFAVPGFKGGQDGGQENDGSEGGQSNDRSEGSEGSCDSDGSQALKGASDTTEARPSKGAGNLAQEGAQLASWVDSAPAVTRARAARRSRVARRPVAGRRRARDLEALGDLVLGLALGMGRGC